LSREKRDNKERRPVVSLIRKGGGAVGRGGKGKILHIGSGLQCLTNEGMGEDWNGIGILDYGIFLNSGTGEGRSDGKKTRRDQ